MESFKNFLEQTGLVGMGGYNAATGELKQNNRYMSAKSRQMIDYERHPHQLFNYYTMLLRSLIATIDVGKLIAGDLNEDRYYVVYTSNELTRAGFPHEEQKMLLKLNILKEIEGYDHADLVKFIGSNNLDKIELFRQGGLLDPNGKLNKRSGYFIDKKQIQEVSDRMELWISRRDMIKRGFDLFGHKLGGSFLQGAGNSRMSPTTTMNH